MVTSVLSVADKPSLSVAVHVTFCLALAVAMILYDASAVNSKDTSLSTGLQCIKQFEI